MSQCLMFWLQAGFTLAGKLQDVQQHGQDRRRSQDSGTVETGGEHREDDGESAFRRWSHSADDSGKDE